MSNIILAWREKKRLQYGLCDSEDRAGTIGSILLSRYNDPDKVEHLFSLGQPHSLPVLFSELEDIADCDCLDGDIYFMASGERDIFHQYGNADIMFIYDEDHTWYCVIPWDFRAKIPLALVAGHLKEDTDFPNETLLREVDSLLIKAVRQRYGRDCSFRAYLEGRGCDRDQFLWIMEDVANPTGKRETQTHRLFHQYRFVSDFFYDWAVAIPNKDNTAIGHFQLHNDEDGHEETINWDN